MYKHVAKQRKLVASNKELQLSDEDSSGNSASSASDSSDNSDLEGSNESGDESDELPGDSVGDEDEEEEELSAPPAGFPSALEALEEGGCIAESEEARDGDREVALVCVVCPNKVLKLGKMLVIHLSSKDHVRRMSRFKKFVTAPEFPQPSLDCDARQVARQLDRIVNTRLSAQTQFGGASTSVLPLGESPAKGEKRARLAEKEQEEADSGSESDDESEEEEVLPVLEGKSKRAEKKSQRAEVGKIKKAARKVKVARMKLEKAELAAAPTTEESAGLKRKASTTFTKPTAEEIAARQAAKVVKREAAAALLATAAAAAEAVSELALTPGQKSKRARKPKEVVEESEEIELDVPVVEPPKKKEKRGDKADDWAREGKGRNPSKEGKPRKEGKGKQDRKDKKDKKRSRA